MADQSPWSRPEGSNQNDPAETTEMSTGSAAPQLATEEAAESSESASGAAGDAPAPVSAADAPDEVVSGEPSPPPVRSDSSGSTVIAVLGMMLLVLSALIAGLVAYVTRDEGTSYPVGRPNDAYALPEMALRQADVPAGMELGDRLELDNAQWAFALDSVDPEARIPQLEAQQRVRNQVSVFGWPDGFTAHLGETLSLLSQSTLYETEEAAREAISGSALCGLRLNETSPVDDFFVPHLGDESVGFFVTTSDPQVGKSIETVICFRTGRVVHGVIQSSFDGAQDIGFVVGMARRMLDRVDASFKGDGDPADEDPEPET